MNHARPRVRATLPLAVFLATLLGLLSAASNAPAADRPPNFIVIFCDNLGYGDIEPFGSRLHRTPNLNRMAREGRKFTHFCVTAGVCTPSRASLMTGCYSQRVGLHTNPRDGWVLRPVSPYGLHPQEETIAEALKQRGYATAIVGKWHLGDQPPFLPTRHGFDWFFGVPYSDDMTQRTWTDGSEWPPLPLMENETVIEAPCDRDGLTRRYTERAMQWVEANRDRPFFLYFPQAMPGSTSKPFASPEFKGRSRNGPWGDAVEELDWSLGVMLQQLRKLGLAENTLVIWTSDNGAPLARDPEDPRRGSNRPLHGRGYTTSEGAFRVPTIAWQPGRVPAGTVCDSLCTTMDLLPTFAALADHTSPIDEKNLSLGERNLPRDGGNLPADERKRAAGDTKLSGGDNGADRRRIIDGHDISGLLYDAVPGESPYEAFYYYAQDQLQAVRSGPWKLFLPVKASRHPHFDARTPPQPLLFNVVEDIACEHNVAAQHPDVVASLQRRAEQAREELGDRGRPGRGQRPVGRIAKDAEPAALTLSPVP